jgi:hypothetical protein
MEKTTEVVERSFRGYWNTDLDDFLTYAMVTKGFQIIECEYQLSEGYGGRWRSALIDVIIELCAETPDS